MPAFWNHRFLRHTPTGLAQPRADELGGRAPAPQPVHALDLDARTDWPTHRIRSFLSMHGGQRGRAGR